MTTYFCNECGKPYEKNPVSTDRLGNIFIEQHDCSHKEKYDNIKKIADSIYNIQNDIAESVHTLSNYLDEFDDEISSL